MEKRLYKSRENRMIDGVCGGIAEYFNIDPTLWLAGRKNLHETADGPLSEKRAGNRAVTAWQRVKPAPKKSMHGKEHL